MKKILCLLFSSVLFINASFADTDKLYEQAMAHVEQQDYAKALPLFEEAAATGNVSAQFALGLMYYRGNGVPRSAGKAKEWFEKAAILGHAKAQFNLGWMYQNGQGVSQSYFNAAKWYEKAAAQEHSRAQLALGKMYAKGQGVTQSDAKAKKWLDKAVAQGNKEAKVYLLEMEDADNRISAQARARAERDAQNKDRANIRANLREQERKKAQEKSQKKSGEGFVYFIVFVVIVWFVIFRLNTIRKGRLPTLQEKVAEVQPVYGKVADNRGTQALGKLGEKYVQGIDTAKNKAQALKQATQKDVKSNAEATELQHTREESNETIVYKETVDYDATQGQQSGAYHYDDSAQAAVTQHIFDETVLHMDEQVPPNKSDLADVLGAADLEKVIPHNKGNGEEKSDVCDEVAGKTIEWYEQAAAQGDAQAQTYLGHLYCEGEGVAQDLARAKKLFEMAVAQGYMPAHTSLAKMHESGQGAIQSYVRAAGLYRKAAAQGDSKAQMALGQMYEKGQGVFKNHEQAIHYYKLACENGELAACDALERLSNKDGCFY